MSLNKRMNTLNYEDMELNKKIKIAEEHKTPFENLPPEVLELIFTRVSLSDLCNVVLTSSHLNAVASAPSLWSKMRVRRQMLMRKGIRGLIGVKRFSKARKLDLSVSELPNLQWEYINKKQWDFIFKNIHQSEIKEVDLSRLDLTVVGDSLKDILPGLTKLNISETFINDHQTEAILTGVVSTKFFKDLNLENVLLYSVNPELLARAVCRLTTVNLKNSSLPVQSCLAVLEKCLESSNLRHVNLEGVDLSRVPGGLLGIFASKLESVNLRRTKLPVGECGELLKILATSGTLKEVDLSGLKLTSIPNIGQAVSRLTKLNLSDTNLTAEQINSVLSQIAHFQKVRELNLSLLNLSNVPVSLILACIPFLRKLNVSNTCLTPYQMAPLLTQIPSQQNLQHLDLSSLNLAAIPKDILADAVIHCKKVTLCDSELLTDQCEYIFFMIANFDCSIEDLDLTGVDLSIVPTGVLSDAIVCLETAGLKETYLSTFQTKSILNKSLQSATLKKLDLSGNILSYIYDDLLSKAVGRLGEVNLGDTKLNEEHHQSLLKCVIESKTLKLLKGVSFGHSNPMVQIAKQKCSLSTY